MSISNLIVPNNYNLYCNTITPITGGISGGYSEFVNITFINEQPTTETKYTIQNGGVYPAIVSVNNDFLTITGRVYVIVNNGNTTNLRISINVPYPVGTSYNRVDYANGTGVCYQENGGQSFNALLNPVIDTLDNGGVYKLQLNYKAILGVSYLYAFNERYLLSYTISCKLS